MEGCLLRWRLVSDEREMATGLRRYASQLGRLSGRCELVLLLVFVTDIFLGEMCASIVWRSPGCSSPVDAAGGCSGCHGKAAVQGCL